MRGIIVGAMITKTEHEKINKLVERKLFLSQSDFVRTAIRDLLEGFSTEEATKRTEQK